MNKKAFLLAEETMKIIIALIAIGFLVYFLTSLYFAKTNDEKREHAEALMQRISEIIDNEELVIETVENPTPVGWVLFSFVGEEKPNVCAGENCLCVCDNVFDIFGRQINECNKDGFCNAVENLEGFEEIKIKKSPFSIEITKEEGMITFREK